MHARVMLQKSLSVALTKMHRARVKVLLGAVMSVVHARRLVLMDLARAWPGATWVRAPLKRLDRLLSNRHLARERLTLYAAMTGWLVSDRHPLIIVDWSDLDRRGRFCLLRAGLATQGRTLTLLEAVYPRAEVGSPAAERRLLDDLQAMLPAACQPIVITDAGFRTPWLREVERRGWHYITRVRSRVWIESSPDHWQTCAQLIAHASSTPQLFAHAHLTRKTRWPCRLVLWRQRHQGRQLLNRQGRPQRNKRALVAKRRGQEPWLLATSLTLPPRQIIAFYRTRMQIEESFRDLKSERFGSGFELSQSRTRERIEVLLLLHALAAFLAYLVALRMRQRSAQVAYGGVVGTRLHYSWLRIASEALRKGDIPDDLWCDHTDTSNTSVPLVHAR